MCMNYGLASVGTAVAAVRAGGLTVKGVPGTSSRPRRTGCRHRGGDALGRSVQRGSLAHVGHEEAAAPRVAKTREDLVGQRSRPRKEALLEARLVERQQRLEQERVD